MFIIVDKNLPMTGNWFPHFFFVTRRLEKVNVTSTSYVRKRIIDTNIGT
jgi:hypothetical protein